MSEQLEQARDLLASGDVAGLLRLLRAGGGELPLGQMVQLVAGAAQIAGFDDLARAASAVAGGDCSGAREAQALYGFGCACLERGAGYLAIRPLALALELAPGPRRWSANSSRPSKATGTRLKDEIARLKERLAQSEGTISELSGFRGQALARLAAQHAEITRLRQEARLAASIRRLPVPSPEEQNLS